MSVMKKCIFLLAIFSCLCLGVSAQEQVHHLVLFKLKPGISKEDNRFIKAVKLLELLPGEIPLIRDFRAGSNFSTRPVAFDYGLLVVVPDEKSLGEYLEHPAHKAAADAWREIADWNIADFLATIPEKE
jgi:hypothetical protein